MENSTAGFRLSPQQAALWSLQQATPHGKNALCVVELNGELRPENLKAALNQIILRHEILRTTFQRPTGIRMPFQVVGEAALDSWRLSDLFSLDPGEQQTAVQSAIERAQFDAFDLERGPVLRAELVKLNTHRHVLILSLAAICVDQQTLTNLVAELAQTYQSQSGSPSFAAEPMQYADFAEWQNEFLEATDELAREGRAFWLTQNAPDVILPLEQAVANNERGTASQSVRLTLDAETVRRLETLAQANRVAVSAVLAACWQALIWRLTDASVFQLYVHSDGRKFADLYDAFGPYAKYVPLACKEVGGEFNELVKNVQQSLDQAQEWQEYFDPSTRSMQDAVAFACFDGASQFTADGLAFSIASREHDTQSFKLRLTLIRNDETVSGMLQYDSRRFEPDTIERFAGYLEKLIHAVAGSAAQEQQATTGRTPEAVDLGAIDLLSEAEREQLLLALNDTAVPYRKDQCLHEIFDEQVARTPEAIALVFGDRQLTYAELNTRANRLAHSLRRLGVTANDRVGLCIDRGLEMIVALLGILKTGAAYVPLNPEHPRERLELQLKESNAAVLVTAGGSIDNARAFNGQTIDLELHQALLANEPGTNPPRKATPDELAYVIYTSGSTGIPKGVAVSHANLANYTQFILQRLAVSGPLHFASVSTISADLGNTCIFPSLLSGGCLHLLSYEVAMSGELFSEYTSKHPIDVLKLVPSHLNALLSAEPQGRFLPTQYLISGGEALSWDLIQRIGRLKPACRIINHYGPTETTVGSLTCDVEADLISPYAATVPIGRPIANTRVYVLDRYQQPAPTGVAGELFIGGAGVTRGYLNQAAETASRFLADPFSDDPGARLYRTGDLVRYLPDGNLEFLGRADHQVKIRGFRVELGEIEAALTSHANIQQAVVVARADNESQGSTSGQRLVAYLLSSSTKPPAVDELRQLLRLKLPDHMVPAAFVFLKSMPLTANGKIDRAALPAPDDLRPELEKIFAAPRTEVESELARIWSSLLKISEVGVHDNFFDLGGHSLLATQVVSRMRQSFKVEISLRSLFESPTIAALAQQIETASATETARLLAELEALSEEEAELLLKQEESARNQSN